MSGAPARLPMFPIGSASLPGSVLTLHVFEPRYRALVQTCLDSETHEFGVVLIERGREVGGGDVRHDVGAVARMLRVAETPDGRYAVVAGVGRRLRVTQWLPDDPYPCAEVQDWPDDPTDTVDPDRLADVARQARRAAALALELGDPDTGSQQELSTDPVVASYQLCSIAPLGDADRYTLLCAAGAGRRIELLAELLTDIEAVLQFRLGRE